ncbi:kinase-like protein [Acaromyces ingoldii]|uniref:Kinase-like protein n=1 Tax=Acaromyces ingoldii TaxID=215250 RepID=A0A316YPN9_9BASI|nr:kinase-like protein [Acaromyces ingoldii]PWN91347.1 kinase-like protein [Acaromyces ingoldii]
MAALPRAKRPRRSAHEPDFGQAMDLGSHPSSSLSSLSSSSHRNGNDVNGYGHTNGSITGGTAVGSTSANPMLQHHSTLVPGPSINGASYRNGASASKQSSVREVIAGKEREVFVVDSTSPPNSTNQHQQHAWNNSDSAAGLANPYATATSSTVPKGKRKAGASPLAAKPASGQTQTALQKRRRYDAAEKAAVDRERGLHPAPAATNHYVDREALSYVAPPPTHTVDDKEGHLIVRSRDYVTGRYQIIRQLGQGTFGKVVECYDIKTRKMVAIKVIRAVQKYRDASKIEIRVLDTLRQHDPLNQNKCIHLLDTFDFLNHVCIVSELLGQSVFDFLKDNSFLPFPSRHIWSFAKQLLQSVAYKSAVVLHRLGLIHTDLKPENILLVNHDYDLVPLTRRANSKRKRVLKESEIRLIDFGSATFQDEYHSMVVSTRHYRAPEIILQMGWTFPCDAWSIGCILVEFFTGEALFQTHDNLEHLAMMEAVLGVMPDDYRRKAETYLPAYFKHGRLDYPNKDTQKQSKKYVKAMKSLDDIIRCPPSFSKFESRFKHLIKRLLTFDPEQRIRVDQALHHPFFELTEDEIPP